MMSVIVYVTVTARQHHASLQRCEKFGLGIFKVSYGVLVLRVFEIRQNVVFDEISGFVFLEIFCDYSDIHDSWDVCFVHSEPQGVSVSSNIQFCSDDVIVQLLQVHIISSIRPGHEYQEKHQNSKQGVACQRAHLSGVRRRHARRIFNTLQQ